MKNKEKWLPKRFTRDKKGRIVGTHMHKIIGNAYEPIIRKYAKGKLVDVGCGDVPYFHFYRDLVNDNTCVDWANSTLETSFLDFEADLNVPLDFLADTSFDTVLCTDVLEHIKNPEGLFSEMTRVLKPNGHLILAVPYLYWIHDNPYDYHRYSHFKLRDFCEKNGLSVTYLEAYGGLPEVMFDLTIKGYMYYRFPFQNAFKFLFNSLGNFLARRKFMKNLSNNSRPTFPLGYVLVATKNK